MRCRFTALWKNHADRDLHDHPWDFFTFILAGEYDEEVPASEGWPKLTTNRRKRFSLAFRPAERFHRVKLRSDSVWSLIFAGKNKRKWGYLTDHGWESWESYWEAN